MNRLGLDGDEQADLSVHGGPEKAIYAYAMAHYPAWASDFPEHQALLVAGGFGENLSVDGLIESDLCVGDIHRIGGATLQVCQPRQPCFKLSLHFADNRMPRAMVRTGRAGWYYRVLDEGRITRGDRISLDHRPNPGFRFDRLVEIVNYGRASPDEFEAMARMEGLADAWRQRAIRALSAT